MTKKMRPHLILPNIDMILKKQFCTYMLGKQHQSVNEVQGNTADAGLHRITGFDGRILALFLLTI